MSTLLHFGAKKSLKSRLGGVLGRLVGVLAACWAILEPSWAVLGRLGGVLRRLGGILGRLRPSWKRLEASRGPLRRIKRVRGADEGREEGVPGGYAWGSIKAKISRSGN